MKQILKEEINIDRKTQGKICETISIEILQKHGFL